MCTGTRSRYTLVSRDPYGTDSGSTSRCTPRRSPTAAFGAVFYRPNQAWRWRGAYRPYATLASYLAPLSPGLMRTVRADCPDAILVQSYSSGRFDVLLGLARALRVPLVALHAGGSPDGYLGLALRRLTLPRADLLVASSAGERDLLVREFGVPEDRVEVILTPIDTNAYRPVERADACHRAGLDQSRRYLLYVGRLSDHDKRVGALIGAFARVAQDHEDVDLLVVGEGLDGDRLREQAGREAPGRIRFLGWVTGSEQLASLYSASECLVLPSRREGFPTVIGEAAACGTPVIGSRVGGVPELVVDGVSGWLVEPGDDDELMQRLAFVLHHPGELARMRPQTRARAEERVAPGVVGARFRDCLYRVCGP